MLLEIEGYYVLSADDGAGALDLFGQHDLDLVFLDYLMPGMDGGEVAQEMKRRKPNVPVFIVSANSMPRAVLTCFIEKGDGPALLLQKLERYSPNYRGRAVVC